MQIWTESLLFQLFSGPIKKEKRDRDQNMVHSQRDTENLHKILERKVGSKHTFSAAHTQSWNWSRDIAELKFYLVVYSSSSVALRTTRARPRDPVVEGNLAARHLHHDS